MHTGAINVYLTDTHAVREAMAAVKPTVMCAVPRFLRKSIAPFRKFLKHLDYANGCLNGLLNRVKNNVRHT